MTLVDFVKSFFLRKKEESASSEKELVQNLKTEIKEVYDILSTVKSLSQSAIDKDLALCKEMEVVLTTGKSNKKAPKEGLDLLSLKAQVLLQNWEKGAEFRKPEELYEEDFRTIHAGVIESEDLKALSKPELKRIFNARRAGAGYAEQIRTALNKVFMKKYSS